MGRGGKNGTIKQKESDGTITPLFFFEKRKTLIFEKNGSKHFFRRKSRRANQILEKVPGHPSKKKISTILLIWFATSPKQAACLHEKNYTCPENWCVFINLTAPSPYDRLHRLYRCVVKRVLTFALFLGQLIQDTFGVQGPKNRFRTLLIMPLNPARKLISYDTNIYTIHGLYCILWTSIVGMAIYAGTSLAQPCQDSQVEENPKPQAVNKP